MGVVLPGLLLPAGIGAQEGGPVSPEAADVIRDTLTRPAPRRGFTLGDALSLPLELVALPADLLLLGTVEVVEWSVDVARSGPVQDSWHAVRRAGFRPSLTTELGSRSGPAIEVAWQGLAPLRLQSGVSARGYQRHRIALTAEASGWRGAGGVEYLRLTQERFWAGGMRSVEADGGDFLEEGWTAEVSLVPALPGPWVVSLGGAWEQTRIGRGQDPDTPDLRDLLGPDGIPGLGRTRLVVGRTEVGYDGRRLVDGWLSGFQVQAGGALHRGVGGTKGRFESLEGDVSFLLPLTSHHHLTLRALGHGLIGGEGEVAFPYLPALGGSESLRSYEWGRFRDRVALSGSAELRWELLRDLRERGRVHALLFVDRGGVAPSFSRLSDMRTSLGVGLGGRWMEAFRAAAWVALGDEGARVSGTLSAGIR